MSRQTVNLKRPSRSRTRAESGQAAAELEHAVKPRARTGRGIFSWAVALATGGVIAWRSIAAVGKVSKADELVPARIPDASSASARPHGSAPSLQPAPGKGADRSASDEGSVVTGAVGLCKEWYARFTRDECLTRSEALAFIIVLSIVPLLLFGLAVLGFVIRDPQQVADYVRNVISHQLPGETARTANSVIEQTHIIDAARTLVDRKWWAAIFGILLLVPSAIGIFLSAVEPMNAAWEVKETRGFISLRLVCLATLLVAGALFILSLVASSGGFHPQGAPYLVNVLLTIAFELLAVAINSAMFAVIYRYLPNAPVTWRAALAGGVFMGVLWEVAKKLFAFYASHFGSFNKVYGTLGGLAGLVTWIWYSCVVLLGGAIVCKMYQEHREEGGVRQEANPV